MGRSALSAHSGAMLSRGPRAGAAAIPAMSVLIASAFALLPIISDHGWWPNMGLLMLMAWRLLRADAWPAWSAAPLGFVNDLLTASPLGLSFALWTFFMLAMDVIDRRTMWRDYWIEWALAAIFITAAELAQWQAASWAGAPVRPTTMLPAIGIAILAFPIAGYIALRLDRWRLGR